jgi:hypothetical protein
MQQCILDPANSINVSTLFIPVVSSSTLRKSVRFDPDDDVLEVSSEAKAWESRSVVSSRRPHDDQANPAFEEQ